MLHSDKNNPFRYYDPRSVEAYKNLKVSEGVIIPTTDEGAWEYFSKFRWVYNKLDIAISQGIKCAPMGIAPEQYPVFMKPIINLHGMGVGSKILSTEEEYDKEKHKSGNFWMEFFNGEHLSHDLVVNNGKILFHLVFKGWPLEKGMFDYWETIEAPKQVVSYLASWIEKNLKDYTGCLNIETINGKIIECHLRIGDIDKLCNFKLMQAIVDIYSGKNWNFNEKIHKFYIFALWGENELYYSIDKKVAENACKGLTIYDFDRKELSHQNPPGGQRLAVLCGHDRDKTAKARYELYKAFKPMPRKPVSHT